MTNTPPAGWYADPTNPTIEHWWNGTSYEGSRPVSGQSYVPPTQPGASYGAAPAYGYPNQAQGLVSPKSRTVASILGFFLGGLGVDRFYLGNVGLGVAKLLVGWLTLGIWPLIDWIIILAGSAHDGQGLKVTNWS